jgi:copper chaperone CopZ
MRLFFVFLVLLSSCNNESSDIVTKVSQVADSEEPNKTLSANVEGMVCKMGCAASIRKELTSIDGVEEVRIDFIEDRAKQELVVLYSDAKTNQDLIVSSIESINKNQFVVSDIVSKDVIE